MKKSLFILATAAIALASCSNDKTVAINETLNDENEITFRPLVKRVMRAPGIDATTLQGPGFTVFATKGSDFSEIYFNETAFTWDGTSSYTSATKYYWPSSGTLDFYAYAYNGAADQVEHTPQKKAFTVTPNSAAASQTDLVFANTNGKSKAGTYDGGTKQYGKDGVPLNFRHAESKVTVQLKNSSTALKVTVSDVAIGYLNTTGTYTYSGSTTNANTDAENTGEYLKFADWTDKSGTGSYTQTATTTVYTSATEATALPQSFILIPQALTVASAYASDATAAAFNGAFITVKLKIQNAANNAYIVGGDVTEVTAMWPLPSGTWNPGYHYTYTVDLAGGGYYTTNQADTDENLDPILEGTEIKFVSVTVDTWGDGGETVVPVPAP